MQKQLYSSWQDKQYGGMEHRIQLQMYSIVFTLPHFMDLFTNLRANPNGCAKAMRQKMIVLQTLNLSPHR